MFFSCFFFVLGVFFFFFRSLVSFLSPPDTGRPKDPITYARNDFELMEVSLLREMLRLQFQAQAEDPKASVALSYRHWVSIA